MISNYFRYLLITGICCLLPCMQSCQETDDLRSELDSLGNRVKALEEATDKMNISVESLQKLMSGSVIVGTTTVTNGYEIELSDGSTIKVYNSEKINAIIPTLSIDKDGYWQYTVDNGVTFEHLKDSEGNFILAVPSNPEGTPIQSPKLRVDQKGYWEVSYDGGTTYKPLLDDEGNQMKATPGNGGNSVFQSVAHDAANRVLKVVLTSGETLSFPIIDTFYLKVLGAQDEQIFPIGEKRIYDVEQSEVAEAIIQAPEGWEVSLTEKQLTIIAPNSNSVVKKETIKIVITSDRNYIRIVPIQVQLLTTAFGSGCTAWTEFITKDANNVLLDFSYAGYKRGEVAPPDVYSLGYKVYNVKDYGATGNGTAGSGISPDRTALLNIISEIGTAKPNANAIIYFPKGEYVLHNEADDVDGKSQSISLIMGNVILKGDGRDKTILRMAAPNQLENPSQLWTAPVMISIKHNGGKGLVELASVTTDSEKGEFSVTVDAPNSISTGSWVCLKLINNTTEAINEELSGKALNNSWSDLKNTGVQVYDYHQVKSKSGNKITFYEPLMHKVKAQYGWKVCDYPHYENVGIEDLTFVGDAKRDFIHHGSGGDDSAFKPISIMRMVNSWMRRVDFKSVSEAFSIAASANVSAYDIHISGERGHSAVRAQASSRVFIGKVIDLSDGTPSEDVWGKNVPYTKGVGQFHASGVSEQSIGSVIWNARWGSDGCFESHAKQPRATLIDQCSGGFVPFREGGDVAQLPNHLDDLTIWNFNATTVAPGATEFRWWSDDAWTKNLPPTIIGFHGANINFRSEEVKRNDNHGQQVTPYSLYEAQLRARLGYVPAWLNSLQ